MPVNVSLIELVRIKGTKHLWPEQFQGFVEKIEANPADRTPWGACADWLDDIDEPGLARAFRFVHRRPKVSIARDKGYGSMQWSISNLPSSLRYVSGVDGDMTTIAGASAYLASQIESAMKELE